MYVQNEKWIAGMTMKDMTEPEHFNMALHACQNENAVLQNRQQLANFLNCELDDFVCAEQTHSANFYQVIHPDKGRGADKLETARLPFQQQMRFTHMNQIFYYVVFMQIVYPCFLIFYYVVFMQIVYPCFFIMKYVVSWESSTQDGRVL